MQPERLVAADFMRRKGYPDIKPVSVRRAAGRYEWLFVYELPEGDLELLVEWDDRLREWNAGVQDFALVE